MSGDGDSPRFRGMLVLPVASPCRCEIPAVGFDQP